MSWTNLEFVKVLGSGNFGEVQLMTLVDGHTESRLVAVKTLHNKVGCVAVASKRARKEAGSPCMCQRCTFILLTPLCDLPFFTAGCGR